MIMTIYSQFVVIQGVSGLPGREKNTSGEGADA